MKTQYYVASSLDGFIATNEHSLDWLLQFGQGEGTSYSQFIREVGAVAMGSSTYEWLLEHIVRPGQKGGQPWPYSQPVWVFTSRLLTKVQGANLRFVNGDVVPVHRQMAAMAGAKNIWIVGGGELVGQFHDRGLLDEVIVSITPVTLGSGKPLLPRRIAKPPLERLAVQEFGPFVEIRYAVPKR
jgi:dihydrofolate reductase